MTEGRTEPYVFRMEQESQMLEQVNIDAPRMPMLEPGRDAGQFSLRPANFVNLPSYGETDLFSALELFPGISYSRNSSELSIRGGTGDQNLVLFDGFTLYNLDHYFGAFSALNPNVVQDMQVFKGGFDSRYGERISGIIDTRGKSGDSLTASLYGGINLLSASITAEVPLSRKFSMLMSGRKGYSSFFSNFLIENIYDDHNNGAFSRQGGKVQSVIRPDYNFYDFNLKLKYKIREGEEISFSAYFGRDELVLEDQVAGHNFSTILLDDGQWNNFGAGLTWTREWNSRFSSSIQAGTSGYFNRYSNQVSVLQDSSVFRFGPGSDILFPDGGPATNSSNEQNYLGDFYVSLKNTYILNSSHKLDFGFTARNQIYYFDSEFSRSGINENLQASSGLRILYLQDLINPKGNLMLKPGLRLNYYPLTGKFYLEPRLSVNYLFDNNIRLKFSAGRYYQFISKVSSWQTYGYNRDYWVLADGIQYPVLRSHHLILGSGIIRRNLMLDIETWYKTFDGLQQLITLVNGPVQNDFREEASVQSFESTPTNIIATGSGRACGFDFLLKYQHSNYQGWISYTLGRSIENFDLINNGSDIPASTDRLHAIDITEMYTTGKWNFSLVYLFSTGQPYLLTNHALNETAVYQTFQKLPNYHRVDVSANYNFTLKNASFRLGLSIINLLDRQNYYDIDRRNFLFNSTSYEETSIIKSQGITPNVFLHFRF
jgi:ferric enterobactin receptor